MAQPRLAAKLISRRSSAEPFAARRAAGAASREATRQRLLTAADELFRERGYAATTVSPIAERAGTSLQTLYLAWVSKTALFRAAADAAATASGRPLSADTWRAEVGRAACEAGADLLNDTWGGWDAGLAEVAAEYDVGLVCSHAGGLPPRTRPFRLAYPDVMADVLATTTGLARRAVAAGVDPARIVIDPAHDFGKNSWHSLEITRRLGEMTATGWPVLLAASRKDFVGETLAAGVDDRLAGTLAVTALSAWLGARIFRAHDVRPTRQALDMVAAVRGDLVPARIVRGLA